MDLTATPTCAAVREILLAPRMAGVEIGIAPPSTQPTATVDQYKLGVEQKQAVGTGMTARPYSYTQSACL